jgi:hypothetical protein
MLLAMGITQSMIRSRLRSGELVVVRSGLYLGTTHWPTEPAAQHLVRGHAEQVANPDAVLSHQTAALAWALPSPGFRDWSDLPVCVTLPVCGHSSRARAVVHHVAALPLTQVQRDREGYPVTSPARTAVDLAAQLALPEALVLLDAAARLICQGLVPSVRRRDYANRRLVEAAVGLLAEAALTVRAPRIRPMLSLVDPGRESAAESLSAGHSRWPGCHVRASRQSCEPRAGSSTPTRSGKAG